MTTRSTRCSAGYMYLGYQPWFSMVLGVLGVCTRVSYSRYVPGYSVGYVLGVPNLAVLGLGRTRGMYPGVVLEVCTRVLSTVCTWGTKPGCLGS